MHEQGGLADQLAAAFKAGVCVGQMTPGLGMGMDIGNPNATDGPHTKAEVNYRQCDNGDECCGNCVHFHANKCEIVSGNIQPQMTCDEFQPKDNPDYSTAKGTKGQDSTQLDNADVTDGGDTGAQYEN